MKHIKVIKYTVEFVIDTQGGAPIEEKLRKDWEEKISQGQITIRKFSAPHEGPNKGKVVFCIETIIPDFVDKYLEENMEALLTYETDLSKRLRESQNRKES